MVYEKYIKRGNKLHGPYYYESYRDKTGKVKKRYLGTTKPKNDFNWLLTGAVFVLITLVLILNYHSISEFSAVIPPNIDSGATDFSKQEKETEKIDMVSTAKKIYSFLTGFVAEEPVEESTQESSIETDSEETPSTETTTETKSEAEETQTEEPEEVIEEENDTIVEIEEPIINETIISVINETLEKPATNETIEQNITSANETISKITIVNKTLEFNITETNITIQNETIIGIINGNATISTIQYDAVLGKPVKWKKNIKLDNAEESIIVEIPKEAENITVYKISEEISINQEINETPNLVNTITQTEQNNASVNEQPSITNEPDINSTSSMASEQQTVTDNKQQAETKKEKVSDEKIKITGKVISAEVISGEISAEINLEKEPKSFIADFFKNLFNRITGKAVDVTETSDITETQEVKEVTINENATEFEIEYETPAPVAYESNISAGKEIIISGPEEIHYENILAFTELPREIPADSINNIKLYHIIEEIINITDNQLVNNEAATGQIINIVKIPVNFDSYDTNNNSLVDYIEWLVPSLSNQTYQLIIEIIKAEHLDSNRTFMSDIYNEVKALDGNWSEAISNNEYVRITFETPLDNTRDITLYPRTINGTPRIEVYEINGNDLIAEFTTLTDNQYNKVFLTGLAEGVTQDVFDLRVVGGSVQIEHIIDPASAWTWNISSAVYVANISVTTQDLSPYALSFKPDGTKMYILGILFDMVYQYNLSDAWNVSSAVNESNFNVTTQENIPLGLFFKSDGTKMYITGSQHDRVYQYNLSDAWNISSAVYVANISVTTQDNSPRDLFFKPDGTKMYIVGSQFSMVYQYNLSDIWNVSSAVYDNVNINVTTQDDTTNGLFFEPNGNKMYVVGSTNSKIHQYNLSIAWNVSSAVNEDNLSVTTQDNLPRGLFFKADGTKMYITGDTTNRVFQYSLSSSDATAPLISIIYPTNNTFTLDTLLDVNYTASDETEISSCWYSNDTMSKNTTQTSCANITTLTWAEGQHNVTIWVNDTANNQNSSSVTFTIDTANLSACGTLSTANSVYNLTQNITSTGTCITVGANNITLNCQGYEINYSSAGTLGYGINNTGYNFTAIKNCIIKEGALPTINKNAIIFDKANNGTIENNTITTFGNSTGIYLLTSLNNNLSSNTITTFGIDSYGIYLRTNSNNNILTSNNITTSGTSGYGIRLSSSSNSNITSNTITTSGSSAGYGIFLNSNSNNNSFSGMNIKTNSSSGYGIYIFDTNHNFTIRDSMINSSLVQEFYVRSAVTGGEFNFTNVTRANGNSIVINWVAGGNGTLNMRWYLDAYANYTNGTAASNSNVSSWDKNNVYQFSNLTNSSGYIARQTLSEYQNINNTQITYYSNYTFNSSLTGYTTQTQSWNMTANRNLVFTMPATDSTLPNVTINTPLNQTYNTNSIIFNVTALDETGMSTCLYTLTNGVTNYTMSNTSSIWNATNSTMLQGSQTVRFYCNDTTNNLNNSETKTFVVDSIYPQINLTHPLNITYTSVQTAINFTASDTNLNTCWYSANNGQTNTTTSCTTNITGLSSNQGSNTWLVGVNDTANNKNMSVITFFVDSINPSINITTPSNNTFSNSNTMNINYTASDANGISSCWYSNDTMSKNTTQTNCANITTITWANGQHNVTVWVNDTSNNLNTSSITFTMDTINPTINFTSPTETNNSYLSRSNIQINITSTDTNLANITINLYNSDSTLNESNYSTSSSFFKNYTNLADGVYYFNATSRDSANNKNDTETRKITIDSTLPVINLISPADAYSSTDTSVTYQYNVTDANSANCSLILDGAIINFNSSVNISGGTNIFTNTTSVASHTWNINCTDNANNIANSSSRAFTITSSSGGGGGGGETITPTTKTFDLDREQISVKLKQGETKELEFSVTNTGKSSLNIYVNSSIKEMMNIIEPNISLAVGESKTITVDVIAKEDKTPDLYLGKIYVKSGGLTKEILVSIEVVSKESLFDIVLEIPKKYQNVLPGEEVSFKVSLTRMVESDRKDVVINYTIKDEEGNLIASSEDTKAIETSMSYVKEVKIPEETKYGKYVLYVQVVYEGKVASANQWFNVGPKSKLTGIIFWVVIIVILIIGIVFIISVIYSKYAKKNYNAIEKDS